MTFDKCKAKLNYYEKFENQTNKSSLPPQQQRLFQAYQMQEVSQCAAEPDKHSRCKETKWGRNLS